MPRYKLTLEYDGSPFAGWQKQANQPTLQGTLEKAIEAFCGEGLQTVCAGRTDAGVHARGQVVHVDFPETRSLHSIMQGINHHLKPARMSVVEASEVPETFDARFSAIRRHYLYRILLRRSRPALDYLRVWQIPVALDVSAMQEAAQLMLGHHDFTSFRDSKCQAKSPEKTLDVLEVTAYGDELHITASARSFLHHQVRIMVGTLVDVGKCVRSPEEIPAIRDARDRCAAGPTAPPHGLYFMRVDY